MISVFTICIPSAPGYLRSEIPQNGQCKYLTRFDDSCDLVVSNDAYKNPNFKKTLYVSVESPISRLKDTSAYTYTATIDSSATYQLAAWYMPKDEEYRTPNPNPNRNGRGVILVSNCIRHRIEHVERLCREGFAIDIYGCHPRVEGTSCQSFKNFKRMAKDWAQLKRNLISNYSYVLAIENAVQDNYVTEKLYDPLLTHTLPYYIGARNVESFVPHPDSIITNSTYLKRVLEDPELYTYHVDGWRDLEFSKYKRITIGFKDVVEDLCRIHTTPNLGT